MRKSQAVGVFTFRSCHSKKPQIWQLLELLQKKNFHNISVNFASFFSPKVTNQPPGTFSWNFVLTKFCWNMPSGFVKMGKYLEALHVFIREYQTPMSINIYRSAKYSQKKVYSEIIKQNGGKHWKFYIIYLLLRGIHFEFPLTDAEFTEVLNKLERSLFEPTSQPQISLLFLEKSDIFTLY